MSSPREAGSRWERHAESFLRKHGLKLLAQNFHCRFGEIDLVMLDGAVLVFVEVRYRRRDDFGTGAETVTRAKQRKLASTALNFLARHRQHADRTCRFDVVSMRAGNQGPDLDWIRGAFDAS